MSQVQIEAWSGGAESPIEIVEHKGRGHPDTLCDALAEELSRALSAYYLDHFGAVLHHNTDKALLFGGTSRTRFGGGTVDAPIEIFLAGRATQEARGLVVPVEALARESTHAWLRRNLHALDVDRHVKLRCLIRPGSPELVDLFLRQARAGAWLANDSSCGAGYAPLSPLEKVVLAVADELRREAAAGATPEIGEDVKIMGVRNGQRVQLTVSCAFVDRFVPSLAAYLERKRALAARLEQVAGAIAQDDVSVEVNAADDVRAPAVYLTVTGTSAESGDDGQVGRGNRVNGLITPYRPMTLEAAAGKNAVSHTGKIYNAAAHRIAARLVDEVAGIAHAEVYLVSQIGRRVDDPQLAHARLHLAPSASMADVARPAEELVRREIAEIGALSKELLRGKVRVY